MQPSDFLSNIQLKIPLEPAVAAAAPAAKLSKQLRTAAAADWKMVMG